jgi:hypothetical protein
MYPRSAFLLRFNSNRNAICREGKVDLRWRQFSLFLISDKIIKASK